MSPAELRTLMVKAEWRPLMTIADYIERADAEYRLSNWRAWLADFIGPEPSGDPVEAAAERAAALEVQLIEARAELYHLLSEREVMAWVRESCRADELDNGDDGVRYLADNVWRPIENSVDAADAWGKLNHYGSVVDSDVLSRSVPSIHMPRWASRLTLIVEGVKVEPLQAISEADALAEGMTFPDAMQWGSDPRDAYAGLWSLLHTTEGQRWEDNPEVVALTFRVVRENIDRIAA